MLKFVKSFFRNHFGVILWVNFICCAIAGAIIGRSVAALSALGHTLNQVMSAAVAGDMVALMGGLFFPRSAGIGGIIVGLFAGALVGLWINIVCGGFLATVLSISKDLGQMKKEQTGSSSDADDSESVADIVGDGFRSTFQKFTSSKRQRDCPFCANKINEAAIVCQFCKKDVPPAPSYEKNAARYKECPFCANKINGAAIVCQFCGKDLPSASA